MIWFLAIVGLIVLAVLMWRAFGPTLLGRVDNTPRVVGPDDDPDFLWRLKRDAQRENRDPHSDDTPQ
ncbi:hypothetical protein IEU95_00425 [Hoyosella rhizosphaerae]|uniref:hypothetical protein n=1 Tax=Hoyosella rhizosphaerae TaxID=1755582 RepID=UPI00166560A9|nr:hypothetical protein [Hoyosella rhizosphaerae]MBN4925285.1 hypothetical protein [Hoyosella rhizosphaerae]